MVTEAVEVLGDNFKVDGFDGDKQLHVLSDPNYIAWGAVTPDMNEAYVYNVETGENVYINEVKRSARNAPYDPWGAAVEYLDWKDRS